MGNKSSMTTISISNYTPMRIIIQQPFINHFNETHPIVVIGSNGQVGQEIVKILSKRGCVVCPTNKLGIENVIFSSLPNVIRTKLADVTKIGTLKSSLSSASAVIFCATARSDKYIEKVDSKGLENVATICKILRVPRLIVISMGSVSRPESSEYIIANLAKKDIMKHKKSGEDKVRAIYSDCSDISYTIIRPSAIVLVDKSSVGASNIELDQGDTRASFEVSKNDVAECVAAIVISNSISDNVSFEMYEANESSSFSNWNWDKSKLEKYENNDILRRNGKYFNGDYEKMFEGLKSDI